MFFYLALEATKPRLRSSRTAAARLGIRCRNLNSSMAFSWSREIATFRGSIRSGSDVTWIIELLTSQQSIRRRRKARHRSSLSRLMSALGQSRHVQRTSSCPLWVKADICSEKGRRKSECLLSDAKPQFAAPKSACTHSLALP